MARTLILTLISMLSLNAFAESKQQVVEKLRTTFNLQASDVYQSEQNGSELKELVHTEYEMVVTKAQRGTVHQACISLEADFRNIDSLGMSGQDRVRLESFLKEKLAGKITDQQILTIPTPISVSVEKVTCISDSSDAVLGLTYQDPASKSIYKVEIAVDPFN